MKNVFHLSIAFHLLLSLYQLCIKVGITFYEKSGDAKLSQQMMSRRNSCFCRYNDEESRYRTITVLEKVEQN